MRIILHWILLSVSVWITAELVTDVHVDPIWVSLVVGACLTLFNTFIKPIIKILTLPINLITFGFFSLIINGAVFWYLGTMVRGFTVSTFWAAFMSALLVSIINWILSKVFHFD